MSKTYSIPKLVPQSVLNKIKFNLSSISGIVEVSTACNLRCSYCFANRPRKEIMNSYVAARIIEQLANVNGKSKATKIIWHGGEPLLAGIDFYKNVLVIQKNLESQGFKLHNSMQTNATLLNDEWIDFLRDNKFGVGSSLDGFRDYHNSNRVDKKGNGTYDQVVSKLLRAKEMGLSIGVICVINREMIPYVERIYSEMKQMGLHFTMSPVTPTHKNGKDLQPLTPDEYADVLIRLFDLWFNDPTPTIRVNPPHSVLKGILYGGLPLFCNADDSCFSKFISFLPDGSVYPCNRFASEPDFILGNITYQDLDTILSNPIREKLLARSKDKLEPCSQCDSNKMCRGGCAHHAYVFYGNIQNPDYYCRAFFKAFNYYYNNVKENLNLASY